MGNGEVKAIFDAQNQLLQMTTTLEFRKLQAIERLTKLEREDVLALIEHILLEEQTGHDWADDLTEAQTQSLLRGMEDARHGRVFDFEEVMATIETTH